MKKRARREKRYPVMVFLSAKDFNLLAKVCRERGYSRADFLRNALKVWQKVPSVKTRPLTGIALERHEARLKREQRERKRARGKG